MSLTKLIMAPIKYFKKDIITFLIIRRHDLSQHDDVLRYISVKPNASISVLRHKVWYLLDLPDYCEEIIILKTEGNLEVPLTELRRGNSPQNPYILEVWWQGKRIQSKTTVHNMLTMGGHDEDEISLDHITSESTCADRQQDVTKCADDDSISQTTMSQEPLALNNLRVLDTRRRINSHTKTEYKKSELSCCISNSSLIFKFQGKKSKDNFANILLKIQSDLNMLTQKVSNLENRISV